MGNTGVLCTLFRALLCVSVQATSTGDRSDACDMRSRRVCRTNATGQRHGAVNLALKIERRYDGCYISLGLHKREDCWHVSWKFNLAWGGGHSVGKHHSSSERENVSYVCILSDICGVQRRPEAVSYDSFLPILIWEGGVDCITGLDLQGDKKQIRATLLRRFLFSSMHFGNFVGFWYRECCS